MKRRTFVQFLGLAPVAVALPAVAQAAEQYGKSPIRIATEAMQGRWVRTISRRFDIESMPWMVHYLKYDIHSLGFQYEYVVLESEEPSAMHLTQLDAIAAVAFRRAEQGRKV